jgi:hypothetical protein
MTHFLTAATYAHSRAGLALSVLTMLVVATITGCLVGRSVRVHEIVRRPACYEDTTILVAGTLARDGSRVPFSNDLVVRRFVDGSDTITAVVRDTFPVDRHVRLPVRVHASGFLGLLIGSPLLVIDDVDPSVSDSTRARR